MAVTKKHWYDNIFLEFYIHLPLLLIQTRLFKEAYERNVYDVCRVHIKFWRWSHEFQLYKRGF